MERLEARPVIRPDRPEVDRPPAERGVPFEVGGVGAFVHAHTVVQDAAAAGKRAETGRAAVYTPWREAMLVSEAGRGYILALDQGTTGSAALVFDRRGAPVAMADREIHQGYPQPGWVEHDPEEIYQNDAPGCARGTGQRRYLGSGSRGDRDHQSARDHRHLGPQDRAGRSRRPWSGSVDAARRSASD